MVPGELTVNRDARSGEARTVTVPADRLFIDVAKELRDRYQLQIPVITEFGSLTMGAAACAATKQASFPEGFGQVGSYAVAMRLVKPDGTIVELQEGDRDFEAVRCSFGLFGVASQLTFRVVPHQDISIRNDEMTLQEFVGGLEEHTRRWHENGSAVKLYMFPDSNRLVAEQRTRVAPSGTVRGALSLRARNELWRRGVPWLARCLDRLGCRWVDGSDWFLRKLLVVTLRLKCVSPVDGIVDFRHDEVTRFSFSMWAFPAREFARILPQYFDFARRHNRGRLRYSTDLPHVSYHIAQDRHSLLSYSYDSDVWTLDPVSTGKPPGWDAFLHAFNEKCSGWGGVPLFNQTPYLNKRHVERAFGQRLLDFEAARRRFDPQNRMLNSYFAKLLPGEEVVHRPRRQLNGVEA